MKKSEIPLQNNSSFLRFKTRPGDWLIFASFVIPIISWFIASRQNPRGWASQDPGIIITYAYLLSMEYWWAIVLVFIVLYFVAFRWRKYARELFGAALFVASTILSIFVFMIVSQAEESENFG